MFVLFLQHNTDADVSYLFGESGIEGVSSTLIVEAKSLLSRKRYLMKKLEEGYSSETYDENGHDSLITSYRNPEDIAELAEVDKRLFDIFVTRQDMKKFSYDFDDMSMAFGDSSGKDPYNWNSFNADSVESLQALQDDLRSYSNVDKAQRDDAQKKREDRINAIAAKKVNSKKKSISIEDAKGNDRGELNFDAVEVMDYDGHAWSGLIIDEDTNQKVMPGGRMLSHRCLVVIGNLRGAGGFGMGKGETQSLALEAAFR